MKKAPIAFALDDGGENSHKTRRRASPKPFSKQRVQEGEIAFVRNSDEKLRKGFDEPASGPASAMSPYASPKPTPGRAWVALGYRSWAEYCKAEFEMSKTRSYQLLDFVEIKQEIGSSQIVAAPGDRTKCVRSKISSC